MKIADPSTVIVEKTAGEFAGTFFEAARSSGMGIIMLQGEKIDLRKYKNNPRAFARVHLEKFIPAAVHALNEIMCNPNTAPEKRELIYKALMERVNDEGVDAIGRIGGEAALINQLPFKHDDAKPKPLIINGKPFDFNNIRKQFNGKDESKASSSKVESNSKEASSG